MTTNDSAAPRGPQQAAAPQLSPKELKLQRNLTILVIFLGFAMLLGIVGIIARVIYLSGRQPSSPASSTSMPLSAASWSLELPPGAAIKSVSAATNKLVVHYEAPGGTGIAIIDMDTGKRLADVKAVSPVPRN